MVDIFLTNIYPKLINLEGAPKADIIKEIVITVDKLNNLPYNIININIEDTLDTIENLLNLEDIDNHTILLKIYNELISRLMLALFEIGITLNDTILEDLAILDILEILNTLYNVYNADIDGCSFIIDRLTLNDISNEDLLIEVFTYFGNYSESKYMELILNVDDSIIEHILSYSQYNYSYFYSLREIEDDSLKGIEDDS